jgi:AraC-like DNA-binding protein
MSFDFADVVNSVSISQLLFFAIFLTVKDIKPLHNKFLALFFGTQLVGILAWMLGKHEACAPLTAYLNTFTLLWAPSLYLYVKSLTARNRRFNLRFVWHGLPFVVGVLYVSVQSVFSIPPSPIGLVVTLQVIGYSMAGIYLIAQYHRKVRKNFSQYEPKTRAWVTAVLVGYIFTCLIPPILYWLGIYQTQSPVAKELISFLPFLVFYNILFFNTISNPVVIHTIPAEERYTGSQLTPEQAQQYLRKLDSDMTSRKLFLEPELSLGELADKTAIPFRYLSQIINQHKGRNFYDYINGLRVEYACNLLRTDSDKTILEILYASGFNSKTSFNTAFKKHTGKTPTQLKREAKNGSGS